MAGWEERHALSETELYYCECADPDCGGQVRLRKPDYERVRANPRLFVVVPGHEIADIEVVIERHEEWTIVEKHAEVDEVIDSLDPRRSS
jgi:hypothetical protein